MLERIGVIERRQIAVERLVDRAFSMSSTSREKLGTRAQALAAEIRKLMMAHAPNGQVAELIESQALLARRQKS
jgi:hypothetical protein